MDSIDIDIADPAFSLGIGGVNDVITSNIDMSDYTMFIYIGAAILVAVIGMFIYKFYVTKQNSENKSLDCEGGFCTMGQRPINANQDI